MNVLNKYWDVREHLSENEYQVLLTSEKLFLTSASFIGVDAQKIIGPPYPGTDYKFESSIYGGLLIAESFEDANKIAELMWWGEEVQGVLVDILPENESGLLNNICQQ